LQRTTALRRSGSPGVYRVMLDPPLPAAGDRWALFLDIDGTLVAIARLPQEVRVDPGLPLLLGRLRGACGGALALVSGRRLTDIDLLFDPLRLPAAGVHGWQRRRADGTLVVADEPIDVLKPLRFGLAAWATTRPGLLFEDKGGSLALHYRLAPEHGPGLIRLARRLVSREKQLRMIKGRKVVEVLPVGADKGTAIAAFLAEPPFAGRLPVYAGDDATDEDGFRVVNRLGGVTIRVADPESGEVASEARYAVPSVAALRRWLAAVAERLPPAESPERRTPAERQCSLPR
jgi:trehalose 6-phosphate phosphatase